MESKKKKRIIISIICLLLLLGAGLGLYIRNNGIYAVTMRLQRLVGDVCLYNDKGKEQSLKEKMTLKSGQSLETAGESLVMVSLDEIKLLTLEENSVADIKAKGKSLEFDLKEGNLFFNVTEKLSEDQRFDIKTSEMLCGIRGTSAYVGKDMQGHEVLMVTDGIVVVDAINPVTKETIHVEVPAPNMITIYLDGEAEGDATISVKMRKFKEEDLPALALDTIAKNAALRERIIKASDFGDEKLTTLAKLSSRPEVTMFGEAAKELQKEGVEDAIPLMSQPAAEMVDAANKAVDIAKNDLPLEVAIIKGLRGVLDVGVGAGYKEKSLTDLMVTATDCMQQVCVTAMEAGVSGQELITIVGVVSDAVVETASEMVQADASLEDINSAMSVSTEVFTKAVEQVVSEGGDALDVVAAVSDKSDLVKNMVRDGVITGETGAALTASIKEIEELPVALDSKPSSDEASDGEATKRAVVASTRSAKSSTGANGNGAGAADGNDPLGDLAAGNTGIAGNTAAGNTGNAAGVSGANTGIAATVSAATGSAGGTSIASAEAGGNSNDTGVATGNDGNNGSVSTDSGNTGSGTNQAAGNAGGAGAASTGNGKNSSAVGNTGSVSGTGETASGTSGGSGSSVGSGTAGTGTAGTGENGTTGSETAGSGITGSGTSGSGESGTSGSGTSGTGTSGTGETGTVGSGTAGTGTAGTGESGTAGTGTSESGTSGSGTSESGTAGTGTSGTGETNTAGGGTSGAGETTQGGGSTGSEGTTAGSTTTPTATPATYTVTFENYDGTELFKKAYEENSVPAYEGNTPSRSASSEYTYAFSGWTNAGTTYGANEALPGVTADVTYTAKFTETKKKYGITVSAGTGGTVAARVGGIAVSEAEVGATVDIVATPDTGYEFTSWTDIQGNAGISALLSSASASFTMPAGAVSLSAVFRALSYQVTLDPTGGTIKSGRVTSYTYGLGAVLPTNVVRDNYSFKGWFTAPTGGTKVEQISTTDTGTKVLYAQWDAVPVNTFAITVNSATNGQITADKANAAKNETVTLSVTPASGYAVDAITVKDDTGRPLEVTEVTENAGYTFKMPESVVTVTASFFEAQAGTTYYTVTVADVFGGTVSLPKNKYEEGENVQFTVTPAANSYVRGVYAVDSTGASNAILPSGTSGTDYSFAMPASDVTLNVSFGAFYTISTDYLAAGGSVKVLSLGNEITTAAGYDTVNLLVKPNSGYSLPDVTKIKYLYKDYNGIEDFDYANNTDQTNAPNSDGYYSFSFRMPYSDVTIPVEFVSDSSTEYSVSAETSMSHGRLVFDKQSYRAGEIVTIMDYPDNGYALDGITVRDGDGNNVQVSDSNTFAMPEGNVTVSAVFVPVYGINIQCDSSVVKDLVFRNATTLDNLQDSAKAGTPVEMSFDINENGDYLFDTIRITDASGNTVPVQFVTAETRDSYNPMTQLTTTVHSYYYSFTMPASAITLSVNVTPKMCEITSLKVYFEDEDGTTTEDTSGTYGSALLDRMTAGFNETVTLSVSPASGYYADTWMVYGNNDGTTGVFTSDSVEITLLSRYGSQQSVSVLFKQITGTNYAVSTESEYLVIDKTRASVGETVTVTVSPRTGYYCKDIKVYDENYNLLSTVFDGVMKNGGTVSFEMPAYEIKVYETWASLHSISIASYYTAGGNVSVSDEWAAEGDNITVSAVPNTGYRLESLKYEYTIYQQTGINGKTGEPMFDDIPAERDIQISNGVGSFDMPGSSATIVAVFAPEDTTEYSIQITGTMEHGSVVADNANAKEGDVVTLTVYCDSGYTLGELNVTDSQGNPVDVDPGTGLSNDEEYVFYMPNGGVTVSATFERTYNISYSNNMPVTYINVSGRSNAKAGETVYVSYADGSVMTAGGNVIETARLSEVRITYGQVSETLNPSGRTYSFVMPESDVEVYGTFEYYYPITIHCGAGGSATADPVEARRGGTSTITITPDEGYALNSFSHEYAEASDFYSYSKGPRYESLPSRNDDGTYTHVWTIEKARCNILYFEFEKESYAVNIDNGITGGQVETDKATAQMGDSVDITVTPEGSNYLKFLSVTGSNGSVPVSYSNGVYRFTMPAGSVNITATFVSSENAGSSSEGNETLSDKLAAKEMVTIDSDMTIDENLTVPSGKALTIAEGKIVTIADGVTLTVSSGAVLNNYGTINVNGNLSNEGTLNNYSEHTINNYGTIVNTGTLVNGDGGSNDGVLRNHEGAVIENEGTIINNEGSTIVNEGTISGNDPVGDGTIIDENADNYSDKDTEGESLYKVTVDEAVTNGKIVITTGTDDGEISASEVPVGARITLNVTPSEGYKLVEESLQVLADNGESIELSFDEEKNLWTFVMPASDVKVKAEFSEGEGTNPSVDEKGDPAQKENVDSAKKDESENKSESEDKSKQADKALESDKDNRNAETSKIDGVETSGNTPLNSAPDDENKDQKENLSTEENKAGQGAEDLAGTEAVIQEVENSSSDKDADNPDALNLSSDKAVDEQKDEENGSESSSDVADSAIPESVEESVYSGNEDEQESRSE